MGWLGWKGEAAKKLARKAAIDGLVASGRKILARSQQEVPVEDGELRDSGRVVRSRAKRPRVLITFGGPSAPYAIPQHERRDYQHPQGGKPRYLADPFNATAPTSVPAEQLKAFRKVFP